MQSFMLRELLFNSWHHFHKIFMLEMASRTAWIVQKRARNAISWKSVSEVLSIGTSYICCKRVTSLITNLPAHLKGQKHAELYAQRIALQFMTSLPHDIHAGNGQPYCLNCSKKSKECHILKSVSGVLSIWTIYICCKRVTSLITNLSAHLKGQKHAELYAQRIAFQFLTSLPRHFN